MSGLRSTNASGALERGVVLAGEPRDEIGPDRRVRQQLADHREALGCERGVVAPAHAAEDPVVRRLQRHVEVRADRRRRRHRAHQWLRHLVRIDGRQANATEPPLLDERVQQPDQIDARVEVVPPPAEVHAGEHDLVEATRRERIQLGEDGPGRQAAARPAGQGNDAEGAEQVAPLLHLQEGARLPVEAACAERLDRRLAPAVADLDAGHAGHARGHRLDEGVEPVQADHVVDRLHGGRRPRLCLRIASGEDHARGRIRAPRAPRQPPALGIRRVGHRAGVDDHDVGGRSGLDEQAARSAKSVRHRRRIVRVHLAAERGDGDARPVAIVRHDAPARASRSGPATEFSSLVIQPPPTTTSPR